MPVFNFQPHFADLVESGTKTQTIRKTCRAKIGDTVYLYTGQRTRQCRKLGEGTVINVDPVIITPRPVMRLTVCGLDVLSMDSFAKMDGFKSAAQLFEWFAIQHGLPFEGWLIKWELR